MKKWKARSVSLLLLTALICLFAPVSISAAAAKGRIGLYFKAYSENTKLQVKWSWDFFKADQDARKVENKNLAIAGIILSGNAEQRSASTVKKNLKELGFSSVTSYIYSKDKLAYPGVVFGVKKYAVGSKHVLCAVFRGSTTTEDWITDVDALLEDGFRKAGENSYKQLKAYMRKHNLTKKNTIFFLTGHSYGAACASQVVQLADIDGLMSEKSAFIYLFAPPNNYLHTRAKDGHLQNIINYVNVEDAVPKVPKRTNCGKAGRVIKLDYERDLKELNRMKQAKFDLCYKLLHGKNYCEDVSGKQIIARPHECYTYLSFLLSEKSRRHIFAFFNREPGISSKTSGKNKKAVIYFSLPAGAKGGEIYFSEKKNGPYRLEATLKDETPLPMTGLKNGKTYYFKIRAFYRPLKAVKVRPISGVKKEYHDPVYTEFSDPYAVQVKKVVSVKLNKNTLNLSRGETKTLKAETTGTKDPVVWSSSNTSVVTVSKKGVVAAKKTGTAKITAKAGGKKAVCSVKVTNGVNLEKYFEAKTGSIKKAFPGCKWDSGRYAYIYKHVVFSDDSTGTIYNIFWDGKTAGVNVAGIYVGMKKDAAVRKAKNGGWIYDKETGTKQNCFYSHKKKKAHMMLEFKNGVVSTISYGYFD